MDLDEDFIGAVYVPLKVVWLRLRRETGFPWRKMSPRETVEMFLDTDQLDKYGYYGAARTIHRAVDIHGYPEVRDFLVSHLDIV